MIILTGCKHVYCALLKAILLALHLANQTGNPPLLRACGDLLITLHVFFQNIYCS